MKNIHILATDKPSRLYLSDYGKELNLSGYPLRNYTTGQHIYITNSEEIKIGDYYYLPRTNSVYKCIEDPTELNLERRLGIAKIILTTDQDLYSVQPIDDEFLEWFVKNPSCEGLEVCKVEQIPDGITYGMFGNDEPPTEMNYKIIIPKSELANKLKQILDNMSQEEFDEEWKKITDLKMEGPSIIIPKEEQKQHLIDMMRNDEELGLYEEPKTKCYCGHTTYCDCGPEQHVDFINSNIDEFDKALKLSKQETLEEASKNYSERHQDVSGNLGKYLVSAVFQDGANYQAERSYSEEEVKRFAFDFYYDMSRKMKVPENLVSENETNVDVWFEQFKKK